MAQPPPRPPQTPRPKEQLIKHAKDFIDQYYASIKRSDDASHSKRWSEVLQSITKTGTYEQTYAELTFGVKTAWRNAPKCIGRIQWSKIQVFDARDIRSARGMFDVLCAHIKFGSNKGLIRSAITVFPPRSDGQHDYRVWNVQLIRYAGYLNEDGSVVGDPASLDFTKFLQTKFNWKSDRTAFDVLPLVLQADGQDPEMFEIPKEIILEVELSHPEYPWFEELGLKWYALPAVSMLALDCGGLEYTAAPFNGWFMGTEIGARDLCDVNRYNITKSVATKMGLDQRSNTSLWKDRVLVEVNIAVLHSFQKQRVTIADHHSASESFMKHLRDEVKLRGGTNGDWPWIVPPMSGSLLEVFHQELIDYKLYPCFEYQDASPWENHVWKREVMKSPEEEEEEEAPDTSPNRKKPKFREIARAVKLSASLMNNALTKRVCCTILFATETGKSENFASQLAELFKHAFNPRVICMRDYDVNELEHEALVLIVGSTFGNGDPPDSGCEFANDLNEMQSSIGPERVKSEKRLNEQRTQTVMHQLHVPSADHLDNCMLPLANVKFAVFGLGSRSYPNFCAFGKLMDRLFEGLGAERLLALGEGDELCGQENSFEEWSQQVYETSCDTFCLVQSSTDRAAAKARSVSDQKWTAKRYRLIPADGGASLCTTLSRVHRREILECSLIERKQLQAEESGRQTILCRLSLPPSGATEYSPGDHLALFPQNPHDIVDAILNKVVIDSVMTADDWFRLETLEETQSASGGIKQTWLDDKRLTTTTLRSALTHLLDITTPPAQSLLRQMAGLATEQKDREALQHLAEATAEYEDWKHEFHPNLAKVLAQFPSLQLTATFLLTQLPLLLQRYYSISCCPAAYPGEVHATVAVIQFTTQDGKGEVHRGVSSSWLNEIAQQQIIPCYIRRAPLFHLPDDQSVPIIMVGPGTGIAPFRSFWQDRRKRLEAQHSPRLGSMVLYFGCRTSNLDFIFRAELEDLVKKRALSGLHVAFSREPGQRKEHVQDLMFKNSKEIYDQLIESRGHIYVCGDVSMASGVCETIENILVAESSMTKDDAKECVMNMREQHRFHEDIFGVTLRISDSQRSARMQAKQEWKSHAGANRSFDTVPKNGVVPSEETNRSSSPWVNGHV